MQVRPLWMLALLVGGWSGSGGFGSGVARAQAAPSDDRASRQESIAVDYLPGDVTVAVGLRSGDEHVERVRALLNELDFYRSATYRSFFRNTRAFAAQVVVAGLAATVDTDAWSAVGTFFGRDLAVGIRLGHEAAGRDGDLVGPGLLLATLPRDNDLAPRLLRAVHGLARPVDAGSFTPDDGGLTTAIAIHASNGKLFHAFTGEALLMSNDRALLLDGLRAGLDRTRRFSATAAYRDVEQTVPGAAAAWGWADVATARGRLQKAGKWPARIPNPLFGFIAGGWWHHISSGNRVVAWAMPAEENRVDLRFRVDGATELPESHRGFLARSLPLRWAADALPHFVAEMIVSRDWAELFSERESLLDRTGVADLAKFLTGTGNFLGDLDLVEDVFPKMKGAMRLVVAEQSFAKATPVPALPAFALVAPITDPDGKLSRHLEKAGQIALTFANYQAMQEKKPTFMMQTEAYRDCRVLSTYYDEIPAVPTVRFNFEPAIGRVADHYIIATSKRLLQRIADAILATGEAGAVRVIPDALSIDGAAVARLFRLNREPLVTNHMLKEDVDRRRAEREVDGWIGVLDFLRGLDIEARTAAAATDLRLSLRLANKSSRVAAPPVEPAAPLKPVESGTAKAKRAR